MWAPVMLTGSELRQDLARVGAVVDAIMELNRAVWQGGALNLPPERWAAVPARKELVYDGFVGVWREVDALKERLTDMSHLPWHSSGTGGAQTAPSFAADAEVLSRGEQA